MKIYFLRHAESTFNVNPQNDFIDCSLTLNGIQQSNNIDLDSFPKEYSFIICSPLRRCIQTYTYSKLTSKQFQINHLFREIRSGCQSDLLHENELSLIETEEQIKQRIEQINNYLLEIKKLNIDNLLIITHADLIWNLTSYQINQEQFGTWVDNAQIIYWKQI